MDKADIGYLYQIRQNECARVSKINQEKGVACSPAHSEQDPYKCRQPEE